jgi:HSP20 family protein
MIVPHEEAAMALVTRHPGPFAELADLQTRFDRMFEGMFERGNGGHALAVDVIDEDDALVIRADVPGLKPEEVKIEVHDDVLTVHGEHEESSEEKNKRYVRRERRYGAFTRSMALPHGVDADDIKASSKDGVVEVRVPKPQRTEARSIEVSPEG